MYQVQITKNETGAPVSRQTTANTVAIHLGLQFAEAVDAEQGIWLVTLDADRAARLERDGYLTEQILRYTVEIEMP